MDPNETLKVIRRHLAHILDMGLTERQLAEHGQELAESVRDLDDWLSRGGFLPEKWRYQNVK